MRFTERKAKKEELASAKLLGDVLGGEWSLHPDHYNIYDIHGMDRDGTRTLVEVKERRQKWATMFLEEKKVLGILDKVRETKADRALYIASIEGEYLVYDIQEIAKSKVITKMMNATTVKSFNNSGKKVAKKVYEFRTDSYLIELTKQRLGKDYINTAS